MNKTYQRGERDEDGGDGGDTSRLDGARVRKCHPLVTAVGEIDELCAQLGLSLAAIGAAPPGEVETMIADALGRVRAELFSVAAMLAVDAGQTPPAAVGDGDVARLETDIADTTSKLPPLNRLILPGGCELACRLHVARCVCRRAERSIVAAVDAGCAAPPTALRYVNRLGDLLFELARLANRAVGVEDQPWTP